MSSPGSYRLGLGRYVTGPVTTTRARRALTLAAAAVLMLALAGCGHATQHRTVAITLVDGRPGFAPNVVTVDKENQVVMNVNNVTNVAHGFTIEGYKRSAVIEGGQSQEIKFRASRGGTFRIYCQLHPMHQTATLVVR